MTDQTQAPAGTPAATPADTTPAASTPAAAAPAVAPEAASPLPVSAEAGDKAGTFEYAPTQHAGLDAALTFVGKHGFGPEHPAIKAAVNGDFSLLRAQLAEKGAPGADAYVMLAENAYKDISTKEQAQRDTDKATLHGIVGGEENWTAIQEWAGKNAEPDEAAAIKTMLGKGGAEMKIAAGFLANAYQRANGGIQEADGAGPNVSDVRGTPPAGNAGLSPKDYSIAVEKAHREHKGREPFESTPAYAKLREARARYKG